MITVKIKRDYRSLVQKEWFTTTALAVLNYTQDDPEAELSILITSDAEVHKLNRDYLGIDSPTDVLSFPSGGMINPESGHPYLGDISIAYPRAEAQAISGGHPVEDELKLLTIHGVLHLLGRDHADAEEKEKMWTEQAEILKSLGSCLQGPTTG